MRFAECAIEKCIAVHLCSVGLMRRKIENRFENAGRLLFRKDLDAGEVADLPYEGSGFGQKRRARFLDFAVNRTTCFLVEASAPSSRNAWAGLEANFPIVERSRCS